MSSPLRRHTALPRRLLAPALALAFLVGGTAAVTAANVAAHRSASTHATAPRSSYFEWTSDRGKFVTCMTRDHDGNIWVGTEDNGVWRFATHASGEEQWTQFGRSNGLGDDTCYSLVCDRQGRVWAGTLNHGVSVFNGSEWQTYGISEGSVGLHVVSLAVNPRNGDVWGATEAGLFRYSQATRAWRGYAREQGLPADQANALCFDRQGDLFVGMQCDGIAIGSPGDNYTKWRVSTGPDIAPNTPMSEGLPTGLVNCFCAVTDYDTGAETIYAGTSTGLAGTVDHGRHWVYLRGEDWTGKVKGLLHPLEPAAPATGLTLFEDYVSCLADLGEGHLLVGHRLKPIEEIDVRQNRRVAPVSEEGVSPVFATAFLPQSDQTTLVGCYGDAGVTRDYIGGRAPSEDEASYGSHAESDLPTPDHTPGSVRLNALLQSASAVPVDADEMRPKVIALADDWQTQGDWLGRYGKYWACLCGTEGYHNCYWGSGDVPVVAHLQGGPNHTGTDTGLRYWCNDLFTKNPRTLELPYPFVDKSVKANLTTWEQTRRESEVNDCGGVRLPYRDGPDVYQTVRVPAGLFTLSLYEHNKDGHEAQNGTRDYRASVWVRDDRTPFEVLEPFPATPADAAHGRVRDFWGGVYKRFLVRGPATVTVRVGRNYSRLAILAAAMLDEVDETPAPYFATSEQARRETAAQREAALARTNERTANEFVPAASRQEAADRLFDVLDDLRRVNSTWWATNSRAYYAALGHWYQSQEPYAPHDTRLARRIATCFYETNQYADWETYQNKAGMQTARQIEQALRSRSDAPEASDRALVEEYVAGERARRGIFGTAGSLSQR